MKKIFLIGILFIGILGLNSQMFAQSAKPGEVIFYPHSELEGHGYGYSIPEGSDEYKQPSLPNDLENEIGSFRVGKGVKLTVFEDFGHNQGASAVFFEGEYQFLSCSWDDLISSFKMERINQDNYPVVGFYIHPDEMGKKRSAWQGLSMGEYFVNDGLLCEDEVSGIVVPEGAIVTVYEHTHKDVEKKGASHVFDEPGNYKLKNYGFDDEMSSVKIELVGYELYKIDYHSNPKISKDDEKVYAQNSTAVNNTNSPIVQKLMISTTESTSYTTSFSNTTSIGFSASVSASATAGGDIYGGETTIETTLTTELMTSITVGEENTTSKELSMGQELEIEVPPGQKRTAKLYAVPAMIEQEFTAYYRPEKGKKGKIIKEEGVLKIRTAIDVRAQVDDPDENPITNTNTNTNETSSSSNNNQTSSTNSMSSNGVTFTIDAPAGKTVILDGKIIIQDGNVTVAPNDGGVLPVSTFSSPVEKVYNVASDNDIVATGVELGTSYTKSAWVKVGDNFKAASNNILSGTDQGQHALFIPKNEGYHICGGHNYSWSLVKSPDPIASGWHHVVLTYDRNSMQMRLYLNGELVDLANKVAPYISNGTNNVLIGGYSNKHSFRGNIKKVAIWDEALNELQVKAVYNNSK